MRRWLRKGEAKGNLNESEDKLKEVFHGGRKKWREFNELKGQDEGENFEIVILDHLSKNYFHGIVKTEDYLESIQKRKEV